MTPRPDYFENIRRSAAARWDQLEADPELAAPWHQLFMGVQSPRHILSELLQNADDAGATEAAVRVEEHRFIFSHDGEDFTAEHFASLCRFGYSNKRALHTIGFRGIGFKSTFSLGDVVELRTPTLSVSFDKRRFTEPRWMPVSQHVASTTVSVAISDPHREREVEKNLEDWLKSPVSLLFFKNIRRLRVGDREMHWGSLGPGPVPDTEWMALHSNPDDPYLLARSVPEDFPPDAFDEIRQERLVAAAQELDFPPCRVEIVLGASGRLYVVLPTGVETQLPFACNAPFIQDPARLKVKDPETSPTNRWLLNRTGALAASVMLRWLEQTSRPLQDRARAYGLYPVIDREDGSLEVACGVAVEEGFNDALTDSPFLLTSTGGLALEKQCVIVPRELFEAWPDQPVSTLFDGADRPGLCEHVSATDQSKLVRTKAVDVIGKAEVLTVLQTKRLPKPVQWRSLLKLWAYLASDITGWTLLYSRSNLRIVPVQGKDVLYSAAEVVRLGDKRLLQSDDDWEFLGDHLLVMNPYWPRFLAEQRRTAADEEDRRLELDTAAALAVQRVLGLEEASDMTKVIERVAASFFPESSKQLTDCVRLTQIVAKLYATPGGSFRFVTRDLKLRPTDQVVAPDDGTVEAIIPEKWAAEHLLHEEYTRNFTSCSPDEWRSWILSGRSGLARIPQLNLCKVPCAGRLAFERQLRSLGATGEFRYPYQTSRHYGSQSYAIADYDFPADVRRHWEDTRDTGEIWPQLVAILLEMPDSFWRGKEKVSATQSSTNGQSVNTVGTGSDVPAAWLRRLREVPCLPDTRGVYHKPSELLRRTPATEPFMDVEPFLHGRLDIERSRPLLTLLGVHETPTDTERLLACLRTLARSDSPPVREVEKWYRRLDLMLDTCSTADVATVRQAFEEEPLVLTETSGWVTRSAVFLSSDEEDAPGAAVVRAAVRELSLWRRLGVAERPTADLAIAWLRRLPSGEPLSAEDVRRVSALLRRHPLRVWNECGHWLNLAREWLPTEELEYALTMQSLVEWGHLHDWVKRKTADFQRLPAELTETTPFSGLPLLASRIEDHLLRDAAGVRERRAWLHRLGAELTRVQLDDDAETIRLRDLAVDLARTQWQVSPDLEAIPYIDGVPAGTPRRVDVLWLDGVLYVEPLPAARLARLVPERLGRIIGRPDVAAALNYCYGRSVDEVSEYVEENFRLEAREEAVTTLDTVLVEDSRVESETARVPAASDEQEATTAGTDDAIVQSQDERQVATALGQQPQERYDTPTVAPDAAPQARQHHPARPARAPIIERFAVALGFRKDGADRFSCADGSRIERTDGEPFPWERRTAAGDLVRYYWPREQCLEHEPLQLDADVWGLLDKFPEMYALVLTNLDGNPAEVTGAGLRDMREHGELALFPATYRLVLDHDGKR